MGASLKLATGSAHIGRRSSIVQPRFVTGRLFPGPD
jgi:hypothetical protein